MSFVQNFWNHWNTSHNAFIRAMRQTIMDQILSSDVEEKTDNKPETSNAENNTTEKNNTEHGKNDKENRNLKKAKAKNMKEEKNFNTTDTEIEIEKNKDNEVKTKFKNNRMNEVREKNVKKYNKTKNVKKHDKLNNDIPKELPSITECIVRILLGWAGFDESRYDDENEWGCTNWCEYVVVVVLAAILLIASLTLTLFWIMYYREGFSWDTNPKLQFNLHPVLMVAGFITFSGFSILLYRICRCFRRIYVKLIHTIFHALAIPCIVVGFLAVLEYHNNSTPPIPNFYSMHSWLGFITMGLFALQFVFGFFSFLILLCCEGATAAFRASMVPIHASFGLTTFMLAIATCLTGLTEKAIFTLGDDYSKGNLEGLVMNVLAIVLIALGILVSYTVRSTTIRPDDSTVFHAKVMSAGSGASAGPY